MDFLESEGQLKLMRDIVISTIDYQINKFAGIFVVDDFDATLDFYNLQKKAEKFLLKQRFDKLNDLFHSLVHSIKGG
jgi:hypothetical protein